MSDAVKSLYNPKTGMIGCVLLQAAYGLSTKIPHEFDTKDWELAPTEGQAIMEATIEQWRFIASMPRETRVARFERMSATS